MKKSVVIFAMMFITVVAIVLSCKRLTVPVPASSCPQISLSSAAGSDTQTVFMNSSVVPITYGITFDAEGDTTGFTVSGLPPGVTGYYSQGVFTITGAPATTVGSPFTYTVSALGSTCQGISVVTGKIIVDSCATMNLSSGIGTDSPTVSVNHPLVNITYSITGTAGVTVSGLPAGVTGNFSAGVLTISGTPTTTVGSPFAYTLVPTSNSCSAIPTIGLITVTP
jgi:hypothetical protein